MEELFNRIGLYISRYCFIFFVFLYSIANIFMTVRQYNAGENIANYYFGITPLHIALVLVFGGILLYLAKKQLYKIDDRKFIIIFLFACFFVGLYWVLSNPQELTDYSDDYNCLRAARLVGSGDYGPLGYKTYINTYPHNLTLVSYFMIFTRLFGDSANLIIRLVNIVFMLLGYYSLYKITDGLFENKEVNNIVIVLMFLSMQFVFYSFFIYGNVLSYSTALFSVWFFIAYMKNRKISDLIISMLAIVFSSAIKNNSLIILVAEMIYLLIHIINNKKPVLLVVIILTIALQYLSTTGVVNFWAKRADYDYSNRLPKICWIAYGLNYDERHPGGYMNEFEVYHYENGFNPEYTKERAKTFINGVLENFKEKPYLIPRFYAQKFLVSFANPEYETFAQYRSLELNDFNQSIVSGEINDCLNEVWDAVSTIISVGLLAYVVFRFKHITLNELICGVIVFGGFLFHSFWEVKAIYTYQYYMYLLPYAAYGIYLLANQKRGN